MISATARRLREQGLRNKGNGNCHTSTTAGVPTVRAAPAEPDPAVDRIPKAERNPVVGETILGEPGEGFGIEMFTGSEVIDSEGETVATVETGMDFRSSAAGSATYFIVSAFGRTDSSMK